jgi:hypothetical protein
MKMKTMKIVKVVWIIVFLVIYLLTVLSFLGGANNELLVFADGLMLCFVFPVGYLLELSLSGFYYFLYAKYKIVVPSNWLFFTLEWVLFFTVGYLQWFVLIPYLFRLRSKLFNKK